MAYTVTRAAHQHLHYQQLDQHFHQHHRHELAIRAHVTPEPIPRLLYRCHTFIHTGRPVWWQTTRTCVYERVQCTSCTSNTNPWRSNLQWSSESSPKRPVHCLAVGKVISTRLPTTTGKSRGLQTYGQHHSGQSPHGIASEQGHSHSYNGAIFDMNRTSSCRSALGQNGYARAISQPWPPTLRLHLWPQVLFSLPDLS